jgi:hypothetical protein
MIGRLDQTCPNCLDVAELMQPMVGCDCKRGGVSACRLSLSNEMLHRAMICWLLRAGEIHKALSAVHVPHHVGCFVSRHCFADHCQTLLRPLLRGNMTVCCGASPNQVLLARPTLATFEHFQDEHRTSAP